MIIIQNYTLQITLYTIWNQHTVIHEFFEILLLLTIVTTVMKHSNSHFSTSNPASPCRECFASPSKGFHGRTVVPRRPFRSPWFQTTKCRPGHFLACVLRVIWIINYLSHTCKSVWLSVWLPSPPNALQVIRSWSSLPPPKKVASHTQSILTLPPQLTKVIRSVSDPLPRYEFSVKKHQFYYENSIWWYKFCEK